LTISLSPSPLPGGGEGWGEGGMKGNVKKIFYVCELNFSIDNLWEDKYFGERNFFLGRNSRGKGVRRRTIASQLGWKSFQN